MPTMEFQGKQYEIDEDGYLINLDDWSKELADHIAKTEDIEMTDAHWEVVNFLRKYYEEYQIAPAVRVLRMVPSAGGNSCHSPGRTA